MASERIRSGLVALCAGVALGDSPGDGDRALAVAREIVRSGGDPSPDRLRDEDDGTPMRALPIGFATATGDVMRRRHMAERITPAGDERALAASCAIAAMGAYAVAGAPMFSVFAAGLEEAGAVLPAAREPLTRAAVGGWTAPDADAPLDALETVAAVVSVLCRGEPSPGAAMRAAAALQCQTEGVAAPAGGIAAARSGGLDGVDWLESAQVAGGDDGMTELVAGLSALRG